MEIEGRADLPCRANCPFLRGWLDGTNRPCVKKLEQKETKCVGEVNKYFSFPSSGPLSFKPDGKRIIVLGNNIPMGTVANGSAAWIKSQS